MVFGARSLTALLAPLLASLLFCASEARTLNADPTSAAPRWSSGASETALLKSRGLWSSLWGSPPSDFSSPREAIDGAAATAQSGFTCRRRASQKRRGERDEDSSKSLHRGGGSWLLRRLGFGGFSAEAETAGRVVSCCGGKPSSTAERSGEAREEEEAFLRLRPGKAPVRMLPRSSSAYAVISIPVEVALHPAVHGALVHLTHLLQRLELLLLLTGSAAATALSLALALPRVILWKGKADLGTLLPSAGLISLPFLILVAASLRKRGGWTS